MCSVLFQIIRAKTTVQYCYTAEYKSLSSSLVFEKFSMWILTYFWCCYLESVVGKPEKLGSEWEVSGHVWQGLHMHAISPACIWMSARQSYWPSSVTTTRSDWLFTDGLRGPIGNDCVILALLFPFLIFKWVHFI